MTSVQLHLALTHVPVILSLVGLVTLSIALVAKNNSVTKTAYIFLLIAGIAAIPVYFSGEGAEEAVEKLPGVSEAIIEEHEEIAKIAMITISVAGLAALAALFSMKLQFARAFKFVVLLLALASGGLMAQTAHLGGQIRHSEIRSGASITGNEAKGGEQKQEDKKQKNDDED